MVFEVARPRCWIGLAIAAAALALPALAQAEGAPGPRIFSCKDASGRSFKSDRLLPECKEGKVLNSDGSAKGDIPPPLSPEEIAQQQECERKNAELLSDQRDRIRRDRTLILKFPNEQKHRLAREKALDDVRKSVKLSEDRIGLLLVERKPLLEEAEFSPPPAKLPPKLKQALDNNDASLGAQKSLAQNQQSEAVRINGVFDAQLAYLRKLWAGTQPPPAPIPSCAIGGPIRK